MVTDEWTVEKALRMGITLEQGAIDLYSGTAENVEDPGSKQLLLELAEDEKKHKKFFQRALEDPKKVERFGGLSRKIEDLQITDRLVEESLSPNSRYQDMLIFAAQSEQKAHDFYTALAEQFKDHPLGEMWERFAEEELRHKVRLEEEYDDVVLREN
ncbi:MAG: ferritin family protein [Candidatus Bathyarchaeia archaeon]